MLKRFLSNLPKLFCGKGMEINSINMAREFLLKGNLEGAWTICQAMRAKHGESADLLALEGGILGIKGDLVEARTLLEKALWLDPEHIQANADLGNIAIAEGRSDDAIRLIDRALTLDPANPIILTNRGQIELVKKRWIEAEQYFVSALKAAPEYLLAIEALFLIYDESEQYQKAFELLDRLLALTPESGHWLRLRGFFLYKRMFQPTQADAAFDAAERAGESSAAFWVDRGICARDLGDGERAVAYFNKAHALEPDNPLPTFHTGLVHLYQQRYAEGWDAYEMRLHDEHWLGTQLPAPRWQGENLKDGILLVMVEQGLGDEIMFASCFEDLPRDMTIYADCAEKLLMIFTYSFPYIRFVPKGSLPAVAVENNDARAIPIGSLPQRYRRSFGSFPRQAYLKVPTTLQEIVREKLTPLSGMKVGISWRSGTEITRTRLRTLPLSALGKLAVLPGIAWVNLQYGSCEEDLHRLRDQYGLNVHHFPELLNPYEMTAALVQQLDLVISVGTAVAHLAGALGQRVWILVPRVPEWRYGYATREMPWYPRAEILRQEVAGCWDEPLAEVVYRLRQEECPSEMCG